MTISIAICTHNGEKYLKEQLDSLVHQTLLPDEVVICDDDSTDETMALLENFKKKAKFSVHIYQNIPALHTIKNFELAVSLTTKELVFFCDQDDLWMPNKLEKMHDCFIKKPKNEVFFSNALLVDEQLQPMGSSLWNKVRFWDQQQKEWKNGEAFWILLNGNRVTGCTMAVRRSFLQKVIPFPTDLNDFIHDAWIALAAAYENKIDFIEDNLINYRQHANQQVGIKSNDKAPITLKERYNRNRAEKLQPFEKKKEFYIALRKHIIEKFPTNDTNLKKIDDAIKHYDIRASLPKNHFKRLIPVVTHLMKGKYHHFSDIEMKYSAPYLAALGDIFE